MHRKWEIMMILQNLNQQGITVILVTHDEEIASYAQRIVRFRDGEIISDEPVAERTVERE